MNKIIINLETMEEQILPLSTEEMAEVEAQQQQADMLERENQAIQEAKASARESARNKLARLGLTDEEIAALLGGA
jgi:hypothetical protein